MATIHKRSLREEGGLPCWVLEESLALSKYSKVFVGDVAEFVGVLAQRV